MIKIFLIVFLLLSLSSFSQNILDNPEILPSYPGGDNALQEFLQKNLTYPFDAEIHQKSGKVIVSFVIEADGTTSRHEVIRGMTPSYGMNEEALRVMKLLTGFEPAKHHGKIVATYMVLPINFTID